MAIFEPTDMSTAERNADRRLTEADLAHASEEARRRTNYGSLMQPNGRNGNRLPRR
jgi:hypothetical protein